MCLTEDSQDRVLAMRASMKEDTKNDIDEVLKSLSVLCGNVEHVWFHRKTFTIDVINKANYLVIL
jgi:hypothetical protein